jgi:hypothetical protein
MMKEEGLKGMKHPLILGVAVASQVLNRTCIESLLIGAILGLRMFQLELQMQYLQEAPINPMVKL